MSRPTVQDAGKESFNVSFQRLSEIANQLQAQQSNPDIDRLVHMVEEAVEKLRKVGDLRMEA